MGGGRRGLEERERGESYFYIYMQSGIMICHSVFLSALPPSLAIYGPRVLLNIPAYSLQTQSTWDVGGGRLGGGGVGGK